jgi:hypothetical protein
VVVFFLQFLGYLIGMPYLHIIHEEHITIMTNPVKHLEQTGSYNTSAIKLMDSQMPGKVR